jgi:hypothetical protein
MTMGEFDKHDEPPPLPLEYESPSSPPDPPFYALRLSVASVVVAGSVILGVIVLILFHARFVQVPYYDSLATFMGTFSAFLSFAGAIAGIAGTIIGMIPRLRRGYFAPLLGIVGAILNALLFLIFTQN